MMQVTAGTIAAKGQGKSNAVVVEGDKDQEQSKDKKFDEMANQGYDDVPAHRNPVCSHWKSLDRSKGNFLPSCLQFQILLV